MSDMCDGVLGLLLGHKFRPRFTRLSKKSAARLPAEAKGPASMLIELTALSRDEEERKIYVCDVCVRCGEMVESEYVTDVDVEAEADDNERLATEAEERKSNG